MLTSAVGEISAPAIRRNLQAIRRRAPGVPLCVAVKADAYGHGLACVLPVLASEGVERVAVANLDEALQARALGWRRPILCLGAPVAAENDHELRERARAAAAARITCTISSLAEAHMLADAAARLHRAAGVEFKCDTGMGRMGLACEGAAGVIAEAAALPGVRLEGVYTHFASADEPDLAFASQQLEAFDGLVSRLRSRGVPAGRFHAANSAAIFRLRSSHLDLVRPGLAVYGYWSGPVEERPPELLPAMRVVSRIVALRPLPPGHGIGYGRTFKTRRPSLIGVVPVGYGDGYRRLLSNNALVTVESADSRRMPAPVLGRVSMDLISIDLTGVAGARVGDKVIVIDSDPAAPNSVESFARQLGTIPYEVTCLIGQRVRRVVV